MSPRVVVLLALVACSKAASPHEQKADYGIVEGPIIEDENKALYVGRSLIETRHLVAKLGHDWREKTKDRRVRIEGTTVLYVCGENEHCLVGGEIHFKSVEKIEILPGEVKDR